MHTCRTLRQAVEAAREKQLDVKITDFARQKERTLVARKVHPEPQTLGLTS